MGFAMDFSDEDLLAYFEVFSKGKPKPLMFRLNLDSEVADYDRFYLRSGLDLVTVASVLKVENGLVQATLASFQGCGE